LLCLGRLGALLAGVGRFYEVLVQVGEDGLLAEDGLAVGEEDGDVAGACRSAKLGPGSLLDRYLAVDVGKTELGQALAHPV